MLLLTCPRYPFLDAEGNTQVFALFAEEVIEAGSYRDTLVSETKSWVARGPT